MKARGRKDKLITYGDGQMRGKGYQKKLRYCYITINHYFEGKLMTMFIIIIYGNIDIDDDIVILT